MQLWGTGGLFRKQWVRIVLLILVVGLVGLGGLMGVGYAQAKTLIKEGDALMESGQYAEAENAYREAGIRFHPFQQAVGEKLSLAQRYDRDAQAIQVAQVNSASNSWQECLDSLTHIQSDSPEYPAARQLMVNCQQKLAAAPHPVTTPTPTASATQLPQPTVTSQPPTTPRSTPTPASRSTTSHHPAPTSTTPKPTQSPTSLANAASALAACSGKSYFSVSPVAVADIKGIVPLGSLNPTSHTFPTNHIYFYLRTSGSAPVQTALYAPGDLTITSVTASEHVSGGYTDYLVTFSPCKEIVGIFDHVTSLTADILSQFNHGSTLQDYSYQTGGEMFHKVVKNVSIKILAGSQIGTVGGRAGQNALDFTAEDTRSNLTFANNSRWNFEHHIVCPLDYFSDSSAGSLIGRLGSYSGTPKRTAPPVCGQFDQDVPGTLQGVWFKAGTTSTYPEDPHLALVHDNIDPGSGAISVGTTLANDSGVQSGVYYFTPANSGLVNRDFSLVRDSQMYCYETNAIKGQPADMAFIVQMTGNSLKIQKYSAHVCGSGPWNFTGSGSSFER